MIGRIFLIVAFAGLASACGGGGGGGGSTPPPPVNNPPSFTSAANVSVIENAISALYVATANDPEGATLTYALAGGADSARFAFDTTSRRLRFIAQPDFEARSDANADNVYEVTLSASDGANTAQLALRVTVVNDDGDYRVRRVATGLTSPVVAAGLPDVSGRVIVGEESGRLRVLDPATGAVATTDFLNLPGHTLLGLAFSPNFANDRAVYILTQSNANPSAIGLETQVRRYLTLAANSAQVDSASGAVILEINHSLGETENFGGMLAFDRDGYLLIGAGYAHSSPLAGSVAQNANSLEGKLLRIDVRTSPYTTPADNAFPGGVGGAREIWALGLRNPLRGSVDPATGDVFIGDRGESALEEIDRINFGTAGPINFGWNLREGTQPFNGGADSASFTPPVAEYPHGAGADQGSAVVGGAVYRGPIDSLQGVYVFADQSTGHIWSAPSAALVVGSTMGAGSFTDRDADFAPNAGTINAPAQIGADEVGNLYFVDSDGEVFVLEPM